MGILCPKNYRRLYRQILRAQNGFTRKRCINFGMERRAFIRYHLGVDALWAFDYLRPYSYKCDLARFCLLYVEGGIYIDLGVRLMNSWSIPIEYGIGAFRDVRWIFYG